MLINIHKSNAQILNYYLYDKGEPTLVDTYDGETILVFHHSKGMEIPFELDALISISDKLLCCQAEYLPEEYQRKLCCPQWKQYNLILKMSYREDGKGYQLEVAPKIAPEITPVVTKKGIGRYAATIAAVLAVAAAIIPFTLTPTPTTLTPTSTPAVEATECTPIQIMEREC